MSVEYESKLTIGWRVEQDDIPDFEERFNEDWPELEELAKRASELLGELTYIEDLCEEENSWGGDTQMIGVPMFRKELRQTLHAFEVSFVQTCSVDSGPLGHDRD